MSYIKNKNLSAFENKIIYTIITSYIMWNNYEQLNKGIMFFNNYNTLFLYEDANN